MRFVLLFVWALGTLTAQEIEARGYSWMVPLDVEWKVTTSDDPRFAAPDFDDSAWRKVRVPDEEMVDYAWIRFRVQAPDPLPAEPLALLLPPLGTAYDLFVNGRPVGSFGDLGAGVGWSGDRLPTVAVFAVPSGSRVFSVAVHVKVNSPIMRQLPPVPRLARRAWLGTVRAIAEKKRQAELEARWPSVGHVAIMSATAMAGLFFLILPLWREDAREYFWCGLFLLAVTSYRPVSAAPWLLESIPPAWIALGGVGAVMLMVVSWERLFSLLLGVQLSPWVRRWQTVGILWPLFLSILTVFLPVWTPLVGLLIPLMVVAVWAGVYLDLERRSPVREETWWMRTAVATYLGGTLVYYYSRLPQFGILLPGATGVSEFAATVRGMGALLFAGVMAMVMNRRAARVQSEQQRLAQEMRAGAEMQALLLSRPMPAGVESVYVPASEVGGDFYQVLERPDGSRVVLVGDVSGKGLKAAMLVSVAVGILRNEKSSSAAVILGALNNGLIEHTGGGFVTCCCARFDPDGTVTIANAGHLAPYGDGREVELSPGLPLGVIRDMPYAESVVPGERFTFISDGVVEAENAHRELFGFERTRAISTKSAREIAEAAKAWGQNDDITVVTVRRTA